jgi:asparagine synthase (glutamine-hydrolysing)
MCGIAGIFESAAGKSRQDLVAAVLRMSDRLRHRGPDDEGCWIDEDAGIAFGHRRLAIVDLSPAGHQPMVSASGRYVLNYNGEIYNAEELRLELVQLGAAPAFCGHSDTELMLAAFEHWGLAESLERFNGMFAFALWDRQQRALYLARDRFGEKPLYYGWTNGTLLFGSELKALLAHPAFRGEIDRDALALFLRYNCIPAPYSIYRGVQKLPPATYLRITQHGPDSEPRAYWSLRTVTEDAASNLLTCGEEEALDRLDTVLRRAVKLRMVADVPLGAFLSGGIDSSTLVALMQAQSAIPVKTFTIGFAEDAYDEARDARAVAHHLGTDHHELYVTPQQSRDVIPMLPSLYDEPFSDSSQIPTLLVSQLARQSVTVALSGDGGDEVFAGYNRYVWSGRIFKRIGWMPRPVRRAIAAVMTQVSPYEWDTLFQKLGRLRPELLNHRIPGDKLHKLAGIFSSRDIHELYLRLVSHWEEPLRIVLGAAEPSTAVTADSAPLRVTGDIAHMMYLDAITYLPDDILTKLDRAAMAMSLEGRLPYLDPDLVAFAWRLPMDMKIRGRKGKWLLRKLLHRYVPKELVERPKMGFGIPLDVWLRGPLREWAEALLDVSVLRQQGYFAPALVRARWEEHLSGRRNWHYHLWDVLMFQAWLQTSTADRAVLAAAVPMGAP